jgi:hypothetical protein
MLSKQKISQTTPVTNINSRKTSNEKKYQQIILIKIQKIQTHNKNNFFHSNNSEDIFSCFKKKKQKLKRFWLGISICIIISQNKKISYGSFKWNKVIFALLQ